MPYSSRQRKRYSRRGKVHEELNLTSMMDMFTIIICFLIKSYSVSEVNILPPPNLKLPYSTSQKAPEQSLLVALGPDVLAVDGEKVTVLEQGRVPVRHQEGMIIRPLLDKLEERSERSKMIAEYNPDFKFQGKMIFQGYQDLPFEVLNSILYTAARAGYSQFQLAAIQKEDGVSSKGSGQSVPLPVKPGFPPPPPIP